MFASLLYIFFKTKEESSEKRKSACMWFFLIIFINLFISFTFILFFESNIERSVG